MRLPWKLPTQLALGDLSIDRRVEHVLAEYDGPQLVTLLDGRKRRYVGVASEADGHAVRWVHASISDLEYTALSDGSQNVRDAILKETVWVVDVSHSGKNIQEWEVPSDDLPSEALPDHDALVPTAAREYLVKLQSKKKKKPAQLGDRFVTLGGKPVVEHHISFRILAVFMDAFQRLCTAFADAVSQASEAAGRRLPWEPGYGSMVRAGLTAPSSYAINVHPADAQVLIAVLGEYKRLLSASDDDQRIADALGSLNTKAAAAYAQYLGVIDDTDLEVLTTWETGSAFVGPYEAKRIRSVSSLSTAVTSKKAEEVRATGHFVGFKYYSRKGSFDFVELGTDERYAGTISPKLKMTFSRAAKITLGPKVIYKIRMATHWEKTKGGIEKRRCELLDFSSIDPESSNSE